MFPNYKTVQDTTMTEGEKWPHQSKFVYTAPAIMMKQVVKELFDRLLNLWQVLSIGQSLFVLASAHQSICEYKIYFIISPMF